MQQSTLIFEKQDGIAKIILNRPELHNAFNEQLIAEFCAVLTDCEQQHDVRVVIVTGQGKSFCAGADLNWMRDMVNYSEQENMNDSLRLAQMMQQLYRLSKPTIAMVNGAAFGGGVGLVSCCDIAITSSKAIFCLSEVKLGLIPAVISPYVIKAIGERAAHRYFLTAEKITAKTAVKLGLIHKVSEHVQLTDTTYDVAKTLLCNGPQAIAECKQLIHDVATRDINTDLLTETAKHIARLRVSAEGQEGLTAFLNKRKPSWIDDNV